jgi:hypothetical protein
MATGVTVVGGSQAATSSFISIESTGLGMSVPSGVTEIMVTVYTPPSDVSCELIAKVRSAD